MNTRLKTEVDYSQQNNIQNEMSYNTVARTTCQQWHLAPSRDITGYVKIVSIRYLITE